MTLGVTFLGTYDRYLKICVHFVEKIVKKSWEGFSLVLRYTNSSYTCITNMHYSLLKSP
jgi:hypothetical protein